MQLYPEFKRVFSPHNKRKPTIGLTHLKYKTSYDLNPCNNENNIENACLFFEILQYDFWTTGNIRYF